MVEQNSTGLQIIIQRKLVCWIPVEQRVYNIDILFISP